MPVLIAGLITGVVVAVVGARAGFLYRRREHLREQRLDAYRSLLAAFLEAARSAADLLSVHTQVGWPRDLNPETHDEGQRKALANLHGDTWERARVDRRHLDVATYGADLVASLELRVEVKRLRDFLEGAAYSGSPWKYGGPHEHHYPRAALNPVDIEPGAIEAAGPFVQRAARELWGRDAPRPTD